MSKFSTDQIDETYKKYQYQKIGIDGKTAAALGLIQRDLYLQCKSSRWPCRIRKVSFMGAEVEVRLSREEIKSILECQDILLQFSFVYSKAMPIPMSYLVHYSQVDPGSVVKLNSDTYVLSLSSSKQPPPSVIEAFGDFFHAQESATNRKETRFVINSVTAKQLRLKSLINEISLDGVKKECVVKDLSSSGCAVTIQAGGRVKPKSGVLEFLFRDPDEKLRLSGEVKRYQLQKGSSDSYLVGFLFDEKKIPPEYLSRIDRMT